MSEISRSEAIEWLGYMAQRKLPYNIGEDKQKKSVAMAISDMEKLEKIEQIFATCERTVASTVFNPKLVCLAVEQIVKE